MVTSLHVMIFTRRSIHPAWAGQGGQGLGCNALFLGTLSGIGSHIVESLTSRGSRKPPFVATDTRSMHFHACGGGSGPRALGRHPRTYGRCKCIWTAKEQSCRIIHHISLPLSTRIQREALRAENRPSWWSARTALHSPISRSCQKTDNLEAR